MKTRKATDLVTFPILEVSLLRRDTSPKTYVLLLFLYIHNHLVYRQIYQFYFSIIHVVSVIFSKFGEIMGNKIYIKYGYSKV